MPKEWFPIEYDITPEKVERGSPWINVRIKNMGDYSLDDLTVTLCSLDSGRLTVLPENQKLMGLRVGEEAELAFHTHAQGSAEVYVIIDGLKKGTSFRWESHRTPITVTPEEAAAIKSLLALATPYSPAGRDVELEATVEAREPVEELEVQFWASTPSRDFIELGKVRTKPLAAGEEARYSAVIASPEEGYYTVFAYLLRDGNIIGRANDLVRVGETPPITA